MSKFDWLDLKDDDGNKVEGKVEVKSGDFHTFQDGDRPMFKIIDASPEKSAAGNAMIKVKFELSGKDGEHGIAYENFVWLTKSLWKHAQLFKATGQLKGDEELSAEDLRKLFDEAETKNLTGYCIMDEPQDGKYNAIAEFEKKQDRGFDL